MRVDQRMSSTGPGHDRQRDARTRRTSGRLDCPTLTDTRMVPHENTPCVTHGTGQGAVIDHGRTMMSTPRVSVLGT
jgi:hypothetical protein